MLHLPSERLAAIADDEPTAAEALHLAGCAQCAAERRNYSKLVETARALKADAAPITDWSSLSGRLADEGLVRGVARSGIRRTVVLRRVGMLAASLALVASGVAAGRYSAGASILPINVVSGSAPREVVINEPGEFSSSAEALNVYLRSQTDIQRAAAYLAANSENQRAPEASVLARLATLEEIHSVMLAGLRNAPNDPVLNDYYGSVVGAREAARSQLSAVPVRLRRNY